MSEQKRPTIIAPGKAEAVAVRDYESRTVWLRVVWRHRHPGITAGTKLTGSALADHLNMETGQLNPSHSTLADETGQTPRAVKKGIDAMRDAGLLIWRPGNGRRSSSYTLTLPGEGGTAVHPSLEQTCKAVRNVMARRVEQKRRKGGPVVPPNLVSNLEENLTGGKPRAPDSAAAAPGWEEEARIMTGEMGKENFDVWAANAVVLPGSPRRFVVDKEFRAKRLREVWPKALDKAFKPGGWIVTSQEQEARRAAWPSHHAATTHVGMEAAAPKAGGAGSSWSAAVVRMTGLRNPKGKASAKDNRGEVVDSLKSQ
jgi:hypothetical protein